MSARVKRDLPRSVIDAHIAVLPDPPAPMDFDELFGGPGPVEVEVGFGKGRFLITSAEAQPETRFIGVEVRDILKEYVANRLAKRSLANAKVMGADARLFMRHAVTDGALDAIHFAVLADPSNAALADAFELAEDGFAVLDEARARHPAPRTRTPCRVDAARGGCLIPGTLCLKHGAIRGRILQKK